MTFSKDLAENLATDPILLTAKRSLNRGSAAIPVGFTLNL